jgi:hypothetical protein
MRPFSSEPGGAVAKKEKKVKITTKEKKARDEERRAVRRAARAEANAAALEKGEVNLVGRFYQDLVFKGRDVS